VRGRPTSARGDLIVVSKCRAKAELIAYYCRNATYVAVARFYKSSVSAEVCTSVMRRRGFFRRSLSLLSVTAMSAHAYGKGGDSQAMRVNQSAVYVLFVTSIQNQSNLGRHRLATLNPLRLCRVIT
jgi:hypothetical protein